MFDYFFSKDRLRKKLFRKANHEVMQKYYSEPFANPELPWDMAEIVSLDFETTGLDSSTDQILSYGKLNIRRGLIRLSTTRHQYIRAEKLIPESSAVIHHITDDQVSEGLPLQQAIPQLLQILAGRVMLVHFNKIEQGFLNAACQKYYGSPFVIPIIDTLVLAQRVLSHRNHGIEPNRLRLFNLRDDFKLPNYKAHNALLDALTTAELFLVLEAEINPKGATPLKDLLV